MEDLNRSNGYNTYRSNNRRDDMPERPPSDALVELHVYLVPHHLWRERYNNFLNQNVTETVSAGIIRVHPEQRVVVLRKEIKRQLERDFVPNEYVFLKSVGRSITKLNSNQELDLKVKNFIPPQSYAPELFLLEAQDVDSSRSSVRPESPEYNSGRKSDRTPYTSHNTNPTSPEYNMSSTENLTSRHPAGGKHSYPSPFHQSPIPKIPTKNNPDPRRYESMDPDPHSTPNDIINNYPQAPPYQTPPRGKRTQSPPSRGDRNDTTPPRQRARSPISRDNRNNVSPPRHQGGNRGHDPASGRDSDTPTDGHHQIRAQHSQSPPRGVVNHRSQSPDRGVDRKSPPRYTNEKGYSHDKPNEHLARIDDDNVATPPKRSERPREIPNKNEQHKSPIREAEQPKVKQGKNVVPDNVQTNGTSRPLSASWGSDQDSQKSPSPGGVPPPKQKPQKGAVPGPPLSATPPPLVESSNRPVAAGNKYDPRLETYTNHTNEDSGIAGLTPEDHYRENQDDILDRRKRENEEKRRREAELQDRLKADQEEREQQQKSMRDKEWERHEQLEEERRRKDEEEKRRREEEKRRQDEEEKRRENEEEARREQERNLDRLSASDEELNRFPSPPPLKMSTPSSSKGPRDSIGGSDTERGQQGRTEKEQLMRELEQAREARKTTEKQREDLVKKAKLLQNKMQNRRNHARDLWKKRYFEEKKRTSPLEEQCNRLRHELEIIHRKLMNTLEGPTKDKATQRVGDLKPSLQVGQYRAPYDPYSPYKQYEVAPSPTYLPRISRQLASDFHPPMSLYTYHKDPKTHKAKKAPPSYATQYEGRRYQPPTQQILNNDNRSNATPYYVNPKSALYTPSNSMSSIQSTPKESSFSTPLGSPKRILYRYDGNAYVSPVGGRKRSAMASTGHSSRSSGKSVQFVERVYYI